MAQAARPHYGHACWASCGLDLSGLISAPYATTVSKRITHMACLIRSAQSRSRVVLPPPSPMAPVSSSRVHAPCGCASPFLRGSICYIVQRGWERASYGELLGARVFPCRPGKCSCAGPAACCIFELAPRESQANAAPSTLLLTLSGTGFASYAQYGVATAWQALVDMQVREFCTHPGFACASVPFHA